MSNEELATAIQAGESDLMDQLWKQCFGFIRQKAMKWARAFQNRSDFDADDLIQAGYIALCEAVRRFKSERGMFLTMLGMCLKKEFAIAAGCRTSRKEPLNYAMSLDAPAYNDEDSKTTVGENIPFDDPGFEDVEEFMFNQYLSDVLQQAMGQLPEKQRMAIELHYLYGKTYEQIAEKWHCSSSYPQECSREGFRKIKNGEFAPALSEILYGDRNYYRHTGFSSWKYSGCSSPEWELIKNEDIMQWRNIRYCIDKLGMTMEQARRLFPT